MYRYKPLILLFITTLLCILPHFSWAQVQIKTNGIFAYAGDTITVEVEVLNKFPINGMEFYILLPNCMNIVKNENYDFGYFTPQFSVSNDQIQLNGQKNVRISLAYAINTDNYNLTLDNFDIYLYNSSGTLVGSSTTTYNNVEIIDVYIPTTGTYTLKIVRTSSTNRTIPMGIAWTQYV